MFSWTRADHHLPDNDDVVLIVTDGQTWFGWLDVNIWRDINGEELHGVTHWAELPELEDA